MARDNQAEPPVLAAYDGSEHARAAIELAGRQLRTDREAIVLSVWEPLESVPFWGAPMSMVPTGMADAAREEAERVAAEGAEVARQAGFAAKPAVIEHTPVWEGIVRAAEERGANLIVMGSHGRSGAAYVALGSIATAVAHHAKVPVLICPRPS